MGIKTNEDDNKQGWPAGDGVVGLPDPGLELKNCSLNNSPGFQVVFRNLRREGGRSNKDLNS